VLGAGEPERVQQDEWVGDIAVRAGSAAKPERIRREIARGRRVVVPEDVVVQASFGVVLLTGEPQRALGTGARA